MEKVKGTVEGDSIFCSEKQNTSTFQLDLSFCTVFSINRKDRPLDTYRGYRDNRVKMKAYPSCVQELHPPCIGGQIFSTNVITSRFNITSNIPGKKIQDITSICACASITCFQPYYHLDQKVLRSTRGDDCSCISNNAEHLGEFGDDGQTPPESLGNYNLNSEGEEACGPRDEYSDSESEEIRNEDGVKIHITKIGKRSRKIESSIQINANLSTVWGVLTDYERLADFIPGLALSRLLEKRDNYVRLFQIGQQNLALGLKFNAKAVLDCFEMDLENLSVGQRRDIMFKMVEGDFEIFEGKWSIQQYDTGEEVGSLKGQEINTILSYVIDVEPKLWLPVGLVEGRLCKEIITNLSCVRNEAQIRSQTSSLSA